MSPLQHVDLATHEIVERRMVARYVQKGQRVMEGGAGIGAVTRVLLEAGAEVVAYEPNKQLCEGPLDDLRLVYAQSNDAELYIHQAALSNDDSPIPFHVYEPWYASRTTALGGAVPLHTILVPGHKFSRELRTGGFHGLVLDIEGAEHMLLREIDRNGPLPQWVVVELHGDPELMASTIEFMSHTFRLDAIEAHVGQRGGLYLVCGWVRHV